MEKSQWSISTLVSAFEGSTMSLQWFSNNFDYLWRTHSFGCWKMPQKIEKSRKLWCIVAKNSKKDDSKHCQEASKLNRKKWMAKTKQVQVIFCKKSRMTSWVLKPRLKLEFGKTFILLMRRRRGEMENLFLTLTYSWAHLLSFSGPYPRMRTSSDATAYEANGACVASTTTSRPDLMPLISISPPPLASCWNWHHHSHSATVQSIHFVTTNSTWPADLTAWCDFLLADAWPQLHFCCECRCCSSTHIRASSEQLRLVVIESAEGAEVGTRKKRWGLSWAENVLRSELGRPWDQHASGQAQTMLQAMPRQRVLTRRRSESQSYIYYRCDCSDCFVDRIEFGAVVCSRSSPKVSSLCLIKYQSNYWKFNSFLISHAKVIIEYSIHSLSHIVLLLSSLTNLATAVGNCIAALWLIPYRTT